MKASHLWLIAYLINSLSYQFRFGPGTRFMKSLSMSIETDVMPQINFDEAYVHKEPKYMIAPTSTRQNFGRKLSYTNKRNADAGIKFRSQYTKLRLLTEDEEKLAGRFSLLGKKLDITKKKLSERLGRDVNNEEWSTACNMTVSTLLLYVETAAQARNRLVQHNLRLVDFWARRLIEHSYNTKEISYYELVAEGVAGLARAAYNYDGKARFFKYAQPWIRSELYKGMTKLRPGSFVNHRTVMLVYRARKMKSKLREKLQRMPTDEEIAEILHVKPATLKKAFSDVISKKTIISAETNLGGTSSRSSKENFVTYLDLFLKSDQQSSVTENNLWRAEFLKSLNILQPIERRAVFFRYGLTDDGIPRSVERTAELLGVSPEYVRRILIKSTEKLRQHNSFNIVNDGPPEDSMTTVNGRLSVKSY